MTQSLVQRFEDHVERTPDAVAVVCEEERLTYRELNTRANHLARRLRGLGVGPESLVAVSLGRSLALVVAIVGVTKAGGAYVPLDPTCSAEQIACMLEDSRANVIVAEGGSPLPPVAEDVAVVFVDELSASAEGAHDESAETTASGRSPRGSNLACVIYTSGSTGRPEGVLLTHSNLVRLFDSTAHWYGFDEKDVFTLFHSYAADFSIWELWGALLHGGRLVVVPFATSRSPEDFYALLEREGVTVLNQSPSVFRKLAHAILASPVERRLSLRFVIFGGEPLDLQGLRAWFARFGDEQPTLVNMYGVPAATVHVTYRPLSFKDVHSGLGSVIGIPIPDLGVHLLDDQLSWVADGEPGEIFVSGPGLARGYLNRPESTAERFVELPGADSGARLYRTGDLARRLPNGELEYLGRVDREVLRCRKTLPTAGGLARPLQSEPFDGPDTLRDFSGFAGHVRGGQEILPNERALERRGADIAFVFPGQGAQYAGMGRALYASEPVFARAVDECAEVMVPALGRDLRGVLFPETETLPAAELELHETSLTQPALFAIEYALAALWESFGVVPSVLAGHGVGEFVAACLGGVFTLEDAATLVAERGRLIQAMPHGAMLSVRAPAETLAERLPRDLALAASDGPSLSVVSGPTDAVQRFRSALEGEGFVARLLHTSHAFHSSMMDPVIAPFEDLVRRATPRAPRRPIVSTATGDFLSDDEAVDPSYWARQLRVRVRFVEALRVLWRDPERILLEVGPRNTCTTLARQVAREFSPPIGRSSSRPIAVSSLEDSVEAERPSLHRAAEQLRRSGGAVDWEGLHAVEPRQVASLPVHPCDDLRGDLEGASRTGMPLEFVHDDASWPANDGGDSELLARVVTAQLDVIEAQLDLLSRPDPERKSGFRPG